MFRLRRAPQQLWATRTQCQSSCGPTAEPVGAAWAPIRGQKEGPRRRIYTIQPEGSAEQEISSGLLVRRWLFSATCLQPRRAVLPDESGPTRAQQPQLDIPQMTEEEAVCESALRGQSGHWFDETFFFSLLKPCCLGSFTIYINPYENLLCTWELYTLGQSMEYMHGV